jgi:ankyrin repeat protein
MKSSFENETIDYSQSKVIWKRDDYRIQAIDSWYEKEICRIHRKLELQVEAAWLSAVCEQDCRGMTPLHYCVCSDKYDNSKIGCLSVLEALLSPVRGGRGYFTKPTNLSKQSKNFPSSGKLSGGTQTTIERRVRKLLSDVVWFQSESIYSSVTGQEVVAFQEEPTAGLPFVDTSAIIASSKSSSFSSSLTKHKQLALSDLTSRYSIDPNLYDTSSPERSSIEPPPVDYEVIIPWLLRNIYKRAALMGEKLGSTAIDILEELVELVDSDFTRTLIVPEIKDLLKSLGIMVTGDIIKELCNMYPGSQELVQEKWKTINQDLHRLDRFGEEDDDDEEDDFDEIDERKTSKRGSQDAKRSSRERKQSKQQQKSSSSKGSKSSLMPELYDDDSPGDEIAESKERDQKQAVRGRNKIFGTNPEEDYGLDFNKLVDDIATGKGMRPITAYAPSSSSASSSSSSSRNFNSSLTLSQHDPKKKSLSSSNQDDMLLLPEEESQNLLISLQNKLSLPQSLSTSLIQRYRRLAVNIVDEYSSTPLLLAAAMNKPEMVEMLLSKGGDLTIPSTDGQTPLMVATNQLIISSLQQKLMKLFQKNKMLIGKTSTTQQLRQGLGCTSMTTTNSFSQQSFGAMAKESPNLLGQKTLRGFGLSHTATPDLPSSTSFSTLQLQQTSLSRSCGNSHGLLLQLEQLHSKRWAFSKTALSWAIEADLDDLVQELVALGANVGEGDAMGRTPLHHCVALASQISVTDSSDLEEAIRAVLKLRSVAEILLQNGADIAAKTVSGRTPLHEMFCRGADSPVRTSSASSLSPSTSSSSSSREISTRSLLRAKALFVRSLLQWGSDPTSLDRHGYGPLHYCAREDMSSCLIEMLKSKSSEGGGGKIILTPCVRGRTILHLACLYGCEETAEVICKWDADEATEQQILFQTDSSGKTPRALVAKDMKTQCLETVWSACREGNSLR